MSLLVTLIKVYSRTGIRLLTASVRFRETSREGGVYFVAVIVSYYLYVIGKRFRKCEFIELKLIILFHEFVYKIFDFYINIFRVCRCDDCYVRVRVR